MGTYHKDGGYSADLDMYITIAGLFKVDVAAIGGDIITLRDPPSLPPCDADLYIIVDGHRRRDTIRFPTGIRPDEIDYRIIYRPELQPVETKFEDIDY